MIVTIDGPAGAGKSSVARELARRLGYRFLDTGAMYRAVAWCGLERNVDWDRPEQLAALAGSLRIELHDESVLVNGRDVTAQIRTPEATRVTRHAADNPAVREHLVRLQRAVAGAGDVVTEGRDQGTVVFPDAQCKVFLTASARERARRRVLDLESRGATVSFEQVLEEQSLRDEGDMQRPVGPLLRPDDAVEVLTDGLSEAEVVDRLEALVRSRIAASRAEETSP
jgi:cytidylate kinase